MGSAPASALPLSHIQLKRAVRKRCPVFLAVVRRVAEDRDRLDPGDPEPDAVLSATPT